MKTFRNLIVITLVIIATATFAIRHSAAQDQPLTMESYTLEAPNGRARVAFTATCDYTQANYTYVDDSGNATFDILPGSNEIAYEGLALTYTGAVEWPDGDTWTWELTVEKPAECLSHTYLPMIIR